ncbi:hypothetical protein K458DRAFT_384330 [Lentithecium fluviatile CBS 122367]|uniref:Uncharacterized protein n=1 Tax=Lentithecium fluviatile CBS 122367 TaxID=1168545 RepID=A0A6G1JGK3_9PLEO|nr:hypothetical protein K458DRAFT_384330 [Lentithecium fluviatile CBS 122367]
MSTSPPSVAHGRPWTPPDTDSDFFTDPFATDSVASDDLADLRDLGDSWPDHELISPSSSRRPKPTSTATDPYYSVKPSRKSDAHAQDGRLEYSPDVDSTAIKAPSLASMRPLLDVHRYPSAPTLRGVGEPTTHKSRSQDKVTQLSAPHTPVKSIKATGSYQNGIPQYPYTPDSTRISRPSALPTSMNPLRPMPWNSESRKPATLMQSALSSCILHLENLIDTRQPNDEQMEYLVTKFEEMAQFLSAPEAQSRQSDDYLFSELDPPSGLGITNAGTDERAKEISLGVGYVLGVEKFIHGIKKYTEDLKMRMDEVKTLNSIQVDIIGDLRRELQSKVNSSPQLEEEHPEIEDEGEEEERGEAQESQDTPPQRPGFWTAVGEALDAVGEMLFEW